MKKIHCLLLALLLCSFGSQAQSQGDTSRRYPAAIFANTGVLMPLSASFRSSWNRGQFALTTVGITAIQRSAFFFTVGYATGTLPLKGPSGNDSTQRYEQVILQGGINNFIPLSREVYLHLKYGASLSVISDPLRSGDDKNTAPLGWVAGAGVFAKINRWSYLMLDVDYQFLSENRSAIRISPGISLAL